MPVLKSGSSWVELPGAVERRPNTSEKKERGEERVVGSRRKRNLLVKLLKTQVGKSMSTDNVVLWFHSISRQGAGVGCGLEQDSVRNHRGANGIQRFTGSQKEPSGGSLHAHVSHVFAPRYGKGERLETFLNSSHRGNGIILNCRR